MNMKKSTCVLALLLAALSFCPSARSQTAYAPGGLFVHPTAYTPKKNTLSTYIAGFNQYEEDGKQDNYIPVSFTYSPTDRLAASALFVYHDGFDHPRHLHFGPFLKYQLVSDAPTHPAFAITGSYIPHDLLEESLAGVFSHTFVQNRREIFIAHTGVKWGQTSGPGRSSDFGGFVGLEIPLSQSFRLVGEYSTRMKFDRAPASSFGVMWRSRGGTGITVGFANSGRSSRPGFFFGVGIPLGGLK